MFIYLFQVAIVFSGLYVLYILLLSKLTFHRLNRGILLAILFLSIILPFLTSIIPPIAHPIEEIPELFEHIATITSIQTIPDVDMPITNNSFNYIILLNTIYFLGVIICLLRFSISIYRLFLLKKQSTAIDSNGQMLYEAPVSDVFSYFHWIFVPRGIVYNPLIIVHEKAHSRLRHTIDIIFVVLYIAFFWWNPLVYLFRKTIKSVHEYQADQYVLQEHIKASDYLQLIVNSLEVKKPHQLYSYFNTPILKKRIDMMTKKVSHNQSKLSYFLLVPICALFFIGFTKPITKDNTLQHIVNTIDTTPTFAFPIKGSFTQQITSYFDAKRKDPSTKKIKVHTGIDIPAVVGTPIIATADGTVFLSKEVGAWGNLIKIKHQDGYETWYAHLKGFATHYGKSVKKGDVIGYVGMTGNSLGPHLHYELRHNNKSINPLDYLEK